MCHVPGVCSPSLFSCCHGNIANTHVNSVLSICASSFLTEVLTSRSDKCEVTTLFPVITVFSWMQSSVSVCSGSHFKGGRFIFIAPLDNHAAAFLYDFMAVWNSVCSIKTDVNLKVPGLNMWR